MLGSPGTGLPLLSSPSCLMHEPAVETGEAREGEREGERGGERGSESGQRETLTPGTAAQHFHILINPIHPYTEREEIAFLYQRAFR